MKKSALILAGIVLLISLCSYILLQKYQEPEFEYEAENIIKLTNKNFENAIKRHKYIFVKFYAPWCGHCQALAPEFSQAASILKNKQIDIIFGSIDATVEKELAQEYDVQGYPSLQLLIYGIPVTYEFARKSQDIVVWIEAKISQASQEVKTVEEMQELINNHRVKIILKNTINQIIVTYFGENNTQFVLYERLSKVFNNITFAHSFNESVKTYFNASQIVLFKQFDERRNDYQEKFSQQQVYQFISDKSLPAIRNFDKSIAEQVFVDVHFIYFCHQNQLDAKEYSEFEQVSFQLKDKLLLSISEINVGMGKQLFEFFGITEDMLPTAFIVNVTDDSLRKYRIGKDLTAENLKTFYNEYLEGKLIPIYKSEEIPEVNDGMIIKVVGKNFKEIVMDTSKDVLVKFYAPWCSFSQRCYYQKYFHQIQQVAPIYENVAKQTKHNTNLIIAEYDATQNENEEINISGYPTIIFFQSNNKSSPIKYDEDSKSEESIINFLKKHSTFKWIENEEQE